MLFPLVVKAQRNMVNMNRHLPEMQAYQIKCMQAKTREEGTCTSLHLVPIYVRIQVLQYMFLAGLKAQNEMRAFFSRTGCHPLKNYGPILGQGAVFCSMFFALRGMATCPVESMKSQVSRAGEPFDRHLGNITYGIST